MQAIGGQSNYFPTLEGRKKPSASVPSVERPSSRINLEKAIRHYLRKADSIADEKASFEKLEIVRELYRRLRKNAGFAEWWAIYFAVAMVLMLAGLLWVKWPKSYFYSYPNDYLRVVQNIDPEHGDFVMQRVLEGFPQQEVDMHFRGYIPQFEAGHTIAWIRYRDDGKAQYIDGFDLVRESQISVINGEKHRLPIFAPNCAPDWNVNHLVCEGGRARWE